MEISLPAIGLFSGAGGMDAGVSSAGFDVRVAVENTLEMCLTYRRNFPDAVVVGPPTHSGDVRDVSGDELLELARVPRGELALLVGGPPCQPFSVAANQRFAKRDSNFKRRGFEDDRRGDLLGEFVRLVEQMRPEAFIVENVPGLRDVDGGYGIGEAIGRLRDLGYGVAEPFVLDAEQHGVPQFRRRLFILGARSKVRGLLKPPAPAFGGHLFAPERVRTVAHALVGVTALLPGHVTREHKAESIARYRRLSFGQREQLGRVDRLDPRRPSKTVIAGGSRGGGRSHLHPYVARTLSVRECARLQTFPDDFLFEGSMARQFNQVGNALPPLLAEVVTRSLAEVVFGLKYASEPRHGAYLRRSQDVSELCEMLRLEALADRPDWMYLDVAVLDQEVG